MTPREYTYEDMRRALVIGWGDKGQRTAEYWLEFNELYFGGQLQPLPIFFTPSTPYGKRLGWTCCQEEVTHIALAAPRLGKFLVADRSTLLHEMIHQALFERGVNPSHDGEPWRTEIMRLHRQITGNDIWAGAPTIVKIKQPDGGRCSQRINKPQPGTGAKSLTQKVIARWPAGVGIHLGAL
jgi:hypothetical protein